MVKKYVMIRQSDDDVRPSGTKMTNDIISNHIGGGFLRCVRR